MQLPGGKMRITRDGVRSARTPGRFSEFQANALREYIEDHLAQSMKIAKLAKYTGLSQPQFKSLFRASFGISPHKYVTHARVDRAIALLHGGKYTLSEIALMSGFADHSHMARWVRRRTGRTLTELRAFCGPYHPDCQYSGGESCSAHNSHERTALRV